MAWMLLRLLTVYMSANSTVAVLLLRYKLSISFRNFYLHGMLLLWMAVERPYADETLQVPGATTGHRFLTV